jgi:response regulator RpfG family c-di-GMP phosphodiesterase
VLKRHKFKKLYHFTVKILLVDDEPLDLFIARKQLSLEYEVNAFGTSGECLLWAKGNDFDIALIDYYLGPDLGSEVLKQLVAVKGKTFKAFLLTNFVDPQQVLALKAEGFDDVIFKPLNIEKLKAHLKT